MYKWQNIWFSGWLRWTIWSIFYYLVDRNWNIDVCTFPLCSNGNFPRVPLYEIWKASKRSFIFHCNNFEITLIHKYYNVSIVIIAFIVITWFSDHGSKHLRACNSVHCFSNSSSPCDCSNSGFHSKDVAIYSRKYFNTVSIYRLEWQLFIYFIFSFRFICISSVFALTSECTALTVTLVLTLRKFLSLIFSIIYFQNPFTNLHWVGTVLVFGGTLAFAEVFNKLMGTTEKKKTA